MTKDQAAKAKAEWLSGCLKTGWYKDQLDDLSAVWDKFKDEYGNMRKEPIAAPTSADTGLREALVKLCDRVELYFSECRLNPKDKGGNKSKAKNAMAIRLRIAKEALSAPPGGTTLTGQGEWVRVEERLPELTEPLIGFDDDNVTRKVLIENFEVTVLGYKPGIGIFKARRTASGWAEVASCYSDGNVKPTHWMPLPSQPINHPPS